MQQQGWTHFHRFGWRRVMEGPLGHSTHYLMARDQSGNVNGVLPLVRVRSMLFGDYLISMPFLNYGGPLGASGARLALAEHAVELARETKVDLLELRCRDENPFPLTPSTRKITVVADIPDGGSEELWKKLDAKVRSQVRRPMKEGVTVTFGADQLKPFYDVFAHHMRDLGTPVLSRKFFETALSEFGSSMWIGVAWLGDDAIACGCGFEWNGEFEMTWASSLRSHSRIAPNMLLYWAFIERAAASGVRTFNFGRCTPGGGTHKFKRQWTSRDEQLWWYQHSRTGTVSTPTPDGRYSFGPRIWRHLPLPIATALGPYIVRNIP
jgi:serine/alanine adding enzyme